MDDHLDPDRLEDLFEIGVDEVSWRKRHKHLTLVSNHRSNTVVWGIEGRDTATSGRRRQALQGGTLGAAREPED